jgi:hypothetical protein
MTIKNTLAYYNTEFINVVKIFTAEQAPELNVLKLVTSAIYECNQVLFLDKPFQPSLTFGD